MNFLNCFHTVLKKPCIYLHKWYFQSAAQRKMVIEIHVEKYWNTSGTQNVLEEMCVVLEKWLFNELCNDYVLSRPNFSANVVISSLLKEWRVCLYGLVFPLINQQAAAVLLSQLSRLRRLSRF